IEPGGLYESEALGLARAGGFTKPMVVYVAGGALEGRSVSLGHAGAVVEGGATSASAKSAAFDEYFGIETFDAEKRYRRSDELLSALKRGIRVRSLHYIPAAVQLIFRMLGVERDMAVRRKMALNPWFVNMRDWGKRIPSRLILTPGKVPEPWGGQFRRLIKSELGASPSRRSMRNLSHASSNDGEVTRIYGRDVTELMSKRSFAETVILYWTGQEADRDFEPKLVEMCLIASLTNGPGTISAQGAKLSASAGNPPNTAMIATLASIGEFHGGNGKLAVKFLSSIFRETPLKDAYDGNHGLDIEAMAMETARNFKKTKDARKEAGLDYERIPCLGHPVFNTREVNFDPRERVIAEYLAENDIYNVFLDFYHKLSRAMHEVGAAKKIWAVNLDAAIATVWLGIAWPRLRDRSMTFDRAADLAFLGFALGRVAGGAGEYLDHRDFGSPMDMRIGTKECTALTAPKALDESKE
ncbi:MAG: hypothetical protein K8R91_04985, partial [Phycisphaerae bacterium]|nr:hypothetical protein [Phycisphaerae bacterium]